MVFADKVFHLYLFPNSILAELTVQMKTKYTRRSYAEVFTDRCILFFFRE
jgi:hypothetical protein